MKKKADVQRLMEVMSRLDKTFKPRLNEEMESSYVSDDPSKEEMQEFLRTKYHSEDDFDVEAAIYWFTHDYHGGQNSNLYSALSTSEFRPGPMHHSIEDEQSELAAMMYQDLVDKYGGGSQQPEPEIDSSEWQGLSMNENKNIFKGKYGYLTIDEPIIPDAIQVISQNPDVIKFTDKQSYDEFADKQRYFSASHSHCFYSPEEMESWRKSGNLHKDPDAEKSDMVFNTGHELVQVWDNKNQIGYVVPSDRNKQGLQEEQEEEFVTHGVYVLSNAGGYEIMLSDDGEQARVRDAFGSGQPETSDWVDIVWVSGKPVIDPYGYNIPLNQVMRR